MAVMWRRSDLHRHSFADDGSPEDADPAEFVASCLAEGLDLVAITDHNITTNVAAIMSEASGGPLVIIPGMEVDTDRGHILVVAPDEPDGLAVLQEFGVRLGLKTDDQVLFSLLLSTHGGVRTNGAPYADSIVLIGAHVDQQGSLLAGGQTHNLADQLAAAEQLQALEVAKAENLTQWSSPAGVKSSNRHLPLVRGSDSHPGGNPEARSTWLHLPTISAQGLRHALATNESSISFGPTSPQGTHLWIKSVVITGGQYDGTHFNFDPRANALIGPPSSGKSFVIDSIRWALGSRCPLPDVAAACDARLDHCLPDGASVTVSLVEDGEVIDITRVQGGGLISTPPFLPITFSQTELTRRAMEPKPSIDLVDIHAPATATHKARISQLHGAAVDALANLVDIAAKAATLRSKIENPQDGLNATNIELAKLSGTEPVTKLATDLDRVNLWRKNVQSQLDTWRAQPAISIPTPAPVPSLESATDPGTVMPRAQIAAILDELRETVDEAVSTAQGNAEAQILSTLPAVEAVQAEIDEELKRLDIGSASTLSQRVATLRAHLADLEQSSDALEASDAEVVKSADILHGLVAEAEAERAALLALRKQSCSLLNQSMRSFIVHTNDYADTADLDTALDDLKTGTNLWANSVQRVRADLDRNRAVDLIAAQLSGKPWVPSQTSNQAMVDQDAIVAEATRREKWPLLAMLITHWPADTISLLQRTKSGDPIPFSDLTEGLRALAIKEISFAASDLPAISDQPEDAVPTTSVFDSLVPTIREQRAGRQFIFASHDANIVVAGDVERVIVLSPVPGVAPTAGTLFDTGMRGAAMDLLEGGEPAFRLRQARYGR